MVGFFEDTLVFDGVAFSSLRYMDCSMDRSMDSQ
jgi:hypothetical protein